MSEPLHIQSDQIVISGQIDAADSPKALMVLAHGAGAGMDHHFMVSLSDALYPKNISVLRFNFPYIDMGRKAPDSPKKAQGAINAVVAYALDNYPELPMFVGGKSYGGRMASHCSASGSIDSIRGLIYYGFPLHAPGRDSKDRADHLKDVKVPMLFLQGSKDKLANIDLIKEVADSLENQATLEIFDSADHSFKVPKKAGISPKEMIDLLANKSSLWIDSLL